MDMWRPYKDAVNTVLPHAKVVLDKFHVVRMANQALDSVRKALRDKMTAKERRTLMRERFILLKRKHDLNERELFLLDTWLGNIPDLKEAYELKEEFYWIFDTNDPYEGIERYNQWKSRCLASNSKDAKTLSELKTTGKVKYSATFIKGSLTIIRSLLTALLGR